MFNTELFNYPFQANVWGTASHWATDVDTVVV